MEDLKAILSRRNHSSATELQNISFITKNYMEEINHGWMVPIPSSCVQDIKWAMVIPVGCTYQNMINSEGDIVKKRRLTHDASWKGVSGESVNDRCDLDALENVNMGNV